MEYGCSTFSLNPTFHDNLIWTWNTIAIFISSNQNKAAPKRAAPKHLANYLPTTIY